jgi:hypothetical protein
MSSLAEKSTKSASLPLDSSGNLLAVTKYDRRKIAVDLNQDSPQIPATLWTASEVLKTGDIRRVAGGKTITYQVAGTTGTVQPILSGRSTITASIGSTNTLTVTAVSGDSIGVGSELLTGGSSAGSRITAQVSGTTGRDGVYTITGNSVATVASNTMAVLTNPSGRAITDGTATGYEDYISKETTSADAPTVIYNATANLAEVTARYGLTRVTLGSPNYNSGSQLLYFRSKCGVDGVVPFVIESMDYRRINASSTYDTFAAAYGYPIGMAKSNGTEHEAIITDVSFGLEFNSGSDGHLYVVTVNGKVVNGTPVRTNNTNSQVIVYDFKGKLTRAVVRVRPCINSESRLVAVHLSAIGKIENGTKSQDTLLCLGDSMWNTLTPVSNGQSAFNSLGTNLKNNLGFEGVVVANAGGSGYLASAGGVFTVRQMITDATNQALFQTYNINHVVIGASLNDNAQTPAAVAAEALLAWRALRALLPKAKITICDAWYHEEDASLSNRRAIAAALKAQFIAWADSNSRFITFHGDGTNSVIFGTGNTTSLITSLSNGTRAKVIGNDNTHFGIYGVSFMSSYLSDAIRAAWNNNY